VYATQIDPYGCGCTECLTGEYVPLNRATAEQVFALLAGDISDATGETFTRTIVTTFYPSGASTESATVAGVHSGLTWTKPEERR
jgi:hypothetical protein